MGLARGGPPPLADVDLWRLRHNQKDPSAWTQVRLLADPEWLLIHFVPQVGGMPHLDKNCPWCSTPPSRVPPRNLAFFAVLRIKDEAGRLVWGRSVLELPDDVAPQIPKPCRGRALDLMRLQDKNYRLRLRGDDPEMILKTAPPAFDVVTVLLRYWGLSREDLEDGAGIERPDVVPFPGRKIG